MVRLAGIEPTTPWFVAKYSIQLSYSREALHYSTIGRHRLLDAILSASHGTWRVMTRLARETRGRARADDGADRQTLGGSRRAS